MTLLHIDNFINLLLKVEYPFLDCNKYVGEVYNPKDWRANTMERSGCAFISCQNRPTSQCLNVQIIIALNIQKHMNIDLVLTVYKKKEMSLIK